MSSPFRSRLRVLLAAAAITVALPLAGCNAPAGDQTAAGLPDLPATLPLALGEETTPVFAPAAADLPAAAPIGLRRVADPGEHYAYADDAWGFADALGEAPPDYGFYYDEVEPWAWQGYDDSLMFVEPLDYGYRSYYYRPGDDYPYFIRDPYWGYGYDDGALVVIYDSYGDIVPYDDYGPRFDYGSRYYHRGRDLYWASRRRHPIIAGNWLDRRDFFYAAQEDWGRDRWRQPAWRGFHNRYADRRAHYWSEERARRRADTVRFAAWREQDFGTPPPPRAIPSRWARAEWARDERRFAPPSRGYRGDRLEQERAASRERLRFAEQARQLRQRDEIRAERAQIRRGGEERRFALGGARVRGDERAAFADRRERRADINSRLAQRTDERRAERMRGTSGNRRLAMTERDRNERAERRANRDIVQQRAAQRRSERAERTLAGGGERRSAMVAERTARAEQRAARRANEVSRVAQRRAERRSERAGPATARRQAEVRDRGAEFRSRREAARQERASRQGRDFTRARAERQRAERRSERAAPATARRQAEIRDRGAEFRSRRQAARQERASRQDRGFTQARAERQRARNETRARGRQEAVSAQRFARIEQARQSRFESRVGIAAPRRSPAVAPAPTRSVSGPVRATRAATCGTCPAAGACSPFRGASGAGGRCR